MIGKNEPTDELNLEILFCVDIFSPVSILEPLFLGISLLAQELIEQENIWRPVAVRADKLCDSSGRNIFGAMRRLQK